MTYRTSPTSAYLPHPPYTQHQRQSKILRHRHQLYIIRNRQLPLLLKRPLRHSYHIPPTPTNTNDTKNHPRTLIPPYPHTYHTTTPHLYNETLYPHTYHPLQKTLEHQTLRYQIPITSHQKENQENPPSVH